MNGISIRRAEERDLPVMCALLKSLFDLEQDFEADPVKQERALRLFSAAPQSEIFLAERGGAVAGMCIVSLMISTAEGGYSGEIEDLVLFPEFRRQGIGEALLAAAEKWACDQGAVRMRLNCDDKNDPAIAFYHKLGWEKSHLFIMFRHC